MSTRTWNLLTRVMLLVAIMVLAASAQDLPPPEEPPPMETMPEFGDPPPDHRGFGRRNAPGRHLGPLEQWFEQLKEQDPQEYERLMIMREEDPEQFREVLKSRIKRHRAKDRFKDFPELQQALEQMPPERRRECLKRLSSLQQGRPPHGGKHEFSNPEINKLEQQSRKLARQVKQAKTPEEQEVLEAQLHELLNRIFDMKTQQRSKMVGHIEKQLEKLQQSLQRREEYRNEIIGRRMRELTEDDSMKW